MRAHLARPARTSLAAWVLIGGAFAQTEGPQELRIDEVVEGVIADGDSVVHTERIDTDYARAPTIARTFGIEVTRSGPHYVELRSWHFDPYLVLRDGEGKVIAEDDDGLLGAQARIALELDAGSNYSIDACALHGRRGPFELVLRSGTPRPLSRAERAAADVADLRRRVKVLEETEAAESPELASALGRLGYVLYRQGRYREAREPWERALAIQEEVQGPEHPHVATSLNDMARLNQAQGELDAARPLYERALAIREKVLGPEHSRTATSLNNLARLYRAQGDSATARPLYERALAIYEKIHGPEHPNTASALNNLAVFLKDLGELDAARPLYERALAIRERALGPDHPRTAMILNNLARLYQAQGDLRAARPLLERALAVREKVLGPEHPDTAQSLTSLAGLLRAAGDYAAARPYIERAIAIREKVLGPGHRDTATSLNNLAELLHGMGDTEAARALYERALAITEKAYGPEHTATANNLANLGKLLEDLNELDAAQQLYGRALAIYEKALGPEHPKTARTIEHLGKLHQARGDLESARRLLERALAVRKKVLGHGHPQTALSMHTLALLLREQGELNEARQLMERALAVRERALGKEHPSVATSLNGLALILVEFGEYEEARPLHERALAIRERVLGPEHQDTAQSLSNLAILLQDTGDYAAARAHFERTLAIRQKALGPEHPGTATAIHNLATLLRDAGELVEARQHYERAYEVSAKARGSEHSKTALSLSGLATVLRRMGELDEARKFQEQALSIHQRVSGPEHPNTATCLDNLVKVLLDQGDMAAARRQVERSLAINERVFGPDHPRTSLSLDNLAALQSRTGELGEARENCERSLRIRERALGPQHPKVAAGLTNLALLLEKQGEVVIAVPYLERALAITQAVLGPEHPFTAETVNNLALLLLDLGELERARELLSRYASGRRAHQQRTLAGLTEAERFQYLAKLRWQLMIRLSLLRSDDAEILTQAYASILDWKGRVARTVIASREQLAQGLTNEQHELLGRLRTKRARLSRLLSEEPSAEQGERLASLRAERNALELELARSLGTHSESDVTPAAVQAALPPRSAVVDFFAYRPYQPSTWKDGELVRKGSWSEEHLVAWIARPDREELVRVDLGLSADTDEAIRAHLRRVVSRRTDAVAQRGVSPTEASSKTDAANDELRRRIWDPLAPWLEDVETVIVSPDGALGTLPLGTIQLEDGTYLVEQRAFVYTGDVSSLVRERTEPKGASGSLLAVGAVDFERRDAAELPGAEGFLAHALPARAASELRGSMFASWQTLPATGPEARAVAELHADTASAESLVLLEGAATEERLKRELGRHEVLHLATHGFFHPEGLPSMWDAARAATQESRIGKEIGGLLGKHPGLLSGLVCAGANVEAPEGADDGYLTAEEVGWLDLSRVELVVLSACETGLGRAKSGEGLIGLRRAFRTAGAKTVVSSLWKVEDESTAELMNGFYENLWLEGMGRLDALRTAQLAMLNGNRHRYGEALPSTWGAFVLSGEWR